MVITDRYDHLIDEKNRMAIPSPIRNSMDPATDGTAFYLVPVGSYMQLIPEKLFHRLAAQSTSGLVQSTEAAEVNRLYFGMASRLEPDKQGRVIIPDRFMMKEGAEPEENVGKLRREVTLVGANDRVELWNTKRYDNHMKELETRRQALQTTALKMFLPPPPPLPGGQASDN